MFHVEQLINSLFNSMFNITFYVKEFYMKCKFRVYGVFGGRVDGLYCPQAARS